MTIKRWQWLALGGGLLGALGTGWALKSFLPVRLPLQARIEQERSKQPWEDRTFPDVDIHFLRCGHISIPTSLAVRGTFSLAPRTIAHSAVLIRHPHGTFLYDTGLCTDIQRFVSEQPWLFRKTLGGFTFEQPLRAHLKQHGLEPSDLDFTILSHLHWDHVSGIPDIPGVPLRISRTEHEAAQEEKLLDNFGGLPRRLLGDNPQEFFDLTGPAYAGFSASLDLFGDGSIVLVPLPGHTRGQVGMFIHRANGAHLFLIADATWIAENYLYPAPMHPLFWSRFTSDDPAARQTLVDLHHFARRHPEIPVIAMHDARMQRTFMHMEELRGALVR